MIKLINNASLKNCHVIFSTGIFTYKEVTNQFLYYNLMRWM